MLIPYQLHQNDEYSFEFITESGIRYNIYFLDYSYMFADYTKLTCSVYSFNIDVIEGNPDGSPGDERVGCTIAEVLKRFFSWVNNVAVYVCDSIDNRQYARFILTMMAHS